MNCNAWYRGPVTVRSTAPEAHGVQSGTCIAAETFFGDTRGDVSRCVAWEGSPGTGTSSASVLVRIDRTAPVVSGLMERGADYGGWYNHPVKVSFRGTDATSGVAACSSAVFSGPQGAGVTLGGTCRDVAGNVGVGSVALNYDATPPAAPIVDARPGNKKVVVRLSARPDAQAEVVRYRGIKPIGLVYRGPGSSFTDKRLSNGRRYRYLVTLIDQAGNRAAGDAAATPTASDLLSPAKGARVHGPPLLEWRKVRGATYYNMQLYRGRLKLLSWWPRVNSVHLKQRWRYGARWHRLVPGRYCWHLWPGFGTRSERDYGRKLGDSCFRVVP